MTTRTKAKKTKGIIPYKGDQLEFEFEDGGKVDLSGYTSDQLTGSHSDQFYPNEIERQPQNPAAFNEAAMWGNRDGWHGYPLLPMDYSGQIFRGLRGGLVRQSNGLYIGPTFIDGKFRLKGSLLAGPIVFPHAKKNAKLTKVRIGEVNAYVKEWEQWWIEWGSRDPECLKELQAIADERDRWKGVTLIHWCCPMDPADELQKKLLCPSSTIIKAIEDLEEF